MLLALPEGRQATCEASSRLAQRRWPTLTRAHTADSASPSLPVSVIFFFALPLARLLPQRSRTRLCGLWPARCGPGRRRCGRRRRSPLMRPPTPPTATFFGGDLFDPSRRGSGGRDPPPNGILQRSRILPSAANWSAAGHTMLQCDSAARFVHVTQPSPRRNHQHLLVAPCSSAMLTHRNDKAASLSQFLPRLHSACPPPPACLPACLSSAPLLFSLSTFPPCVLCLPALCPATMRP